MGYENINLPKKNSVTKKPDMEQTAEDTETFLGNHQQKQAKENKEFQAATPAQESSLENKVEERPLFAPIDKADFPMTSKVDSILSKELKNISLDENHFVLPVPNPDDISGIKINVYLFGTKEFVKIHISTKSKVVDVIRHLITITK